MSTKLLVTGGSGFIGRAICRLALEHGHEVVSISRSGHPSTWAPWMQHVAWVAADVLEPDTWRNHLAGCQALIHCVAIIREKPSEGVTFERINGEAAMIAADEAEAASVEKFVFLSAYPHLPLVPDRFMQAKRRAEDHLRQQRNLQHTILRPAMVYGTGAGRAPTVLLGKLQEGLLPLPLIGSALAPMRPLPVETVAGAALHAALTPPHTGTFAVDDIERLATSLDPLLAPHDETGRYVPLSLGVALGGLAGWYALSKSRSSSG